MATDNTTPGRNGTTTVHTDSFAVFGEIQTGPPITPDDPTRWHPVLLTEEEVCKRYDATPDDLIAWQQRFGFPAPRTKQAVSRFSWAVRTVRSFVLDELDAWDEAVLAVAAHVCRDSR
jgi:hypothetical protein